LTSTNLARCSSGNSWAASLALNTSQYSVEQCLLNLAGLCNAPISMPRPSSFRYPPRRCRSRYPLLEARAPRILRKMTRKFGALRMISQKTYFWGRESASLVSRVTGAACRLGQNCRFSAMSQKPL